MKTQKNGFSLIELLIALLIGSVVLIGVYSTLISNQTAYSAVISNQSITSSNRTITSLIRFYLAQAGHQRLDDLLRGSIFPPSQTTPGTGPFNWTFAAGQVITGRDNIVGLAGVQNGTDAIAIRLYGDGVGTTTAAGAPISNAPSIGCDGTPLPIRLEPTVITLFVRAQNGNSELVCTDNSGLGQTQTPAVILYDGVDQLQAVYGTSAASGLTYASAAAPPPWFLVQKTKVSVLIRNQIERSSNQLQGVAETRSYNLLGTNFTPVVAPNANKQLRQVITETILLPNAVVTPII